MAGPRADAALSLAGTVADLVRIDARNPWLVAGGAGEGRIAAWLLERLGPLEALGLEVHADEIAPGRPNVVARLRGATAGPTLCLNAHLDTVGDGGWSERAYAPRVEDGWLVGLGAADDKAHCAVQLGVLERLVRDGPPLAGDLLVAWVADEEAESLGTADLLLRYPMAACLVLEAFGLGRALVTHQGFGWLDIVVEGVAAHGSAPERGVDAISHLAAIVGELDRHYRERFVANPHRLNGVTVYHASTVAGGTDYATYPAEARLGIEIGTQPGETIADRLAEIELILNGLRDSIPALRARIEVRLHRPPFEARGHERLWDALDVATRETLGRPLEAAGQNAWMDTGLFGQAGIPALSVGAGGRNLHAPDEAVDLGELTTLAEIVHDAVVRYLAPR